MTYDAVVIGAGPAGAVSALMLARAGWSVAIVEKSEFPRRKVCGEFMSATNLPLFAQLGLADAIAAQAGPEIRRMGLYARDATLTAPMPQPRGAGGWGRALGRDVLDVLLLDRAIAEGATCFQPWAVTGVRRTGTIHHCTLSHRGQTAQITAPVVIDAHGAWGPSHIAAPTLPHHPSDLLGFKAHFRGGRLAAELMPLLVFSGGYGGLVTTNDAKICFGCCIRRDVMERARTEHDGAAADAVLAYIKQQCHGVGSVLNGATLDGPWLGAGPIRPGLRAPYADGVFRIGNAAGEAHSLVGEGMSMAMQAAWLLAGCLTSTDGARSGRGLDVIGQHYANAWSRRFRPRIRAASLFAHLAMRRTTISVLLPVLTRLPSLLTFGAARSGKTHLVVGA